MSFKLTANLKFDLPYGLGSSIRLLTWLAIVWPNLVFPDQQNGEVNSRVIFNDGNHEGVVSGLFFSANGDHLLSVGVDKTLRLWTTQTGKLVSTIFLPQGHGSQGAIYASAFSPDDKYLATGGDSRPARLKDREKPHKQRIHIVSAEKGGVAGVFLGGDASITQLRFSASGSELYAGDADGNLRLWHFNPANLDLASPVEPEAERVINVCHSPILSVASHLDGEIIIAGSEAGKISFCQRADDGSYTLLDGSRRHDGAIGGLCIDEANQTLISVGSDGVLKFWSLLDGNLQHSIKSLQSNGFTVGLETHWRSKIQMFGEGSFVAPVLSSGSELGVYSRDSIQPERLIDFHNSPVCEIASSKSSGLIATFGGLDNQIVIWNARTGEKVSEFNQSPIWRTSTVSGNSFAEVKIFELSVVRQRRIPWPEISQIEIFEGSGQKKSPEPRRKITYRYSEHGRSVNFSNFSDDSFFAKMRDDDLRPIYDYGGKTLELDGPNSVRVGGDEVSLDDRLTANPQLSSISFTPDGNVLVGSGDSFESNYAINLYDKDGLLLREFIGHTGYVTSLVPSANGKWFVSTGRDRTIRLWDIQTGECAAVQYVTNGGSAVVSASGFFDAVGISNVRRLSWEDETTSPLLENQAKTRRELYDPDRVRREMKSFLK